MNKPIVMMAAAALFSFSAQAQSVEEGIKMVKYERYVSAKTILEPLAATNPLANYYLGLAELGLEHNDAAKAIFMKYPADLANTAGLARLAYAEGNATEGQKLANDIAAKAGKKDAQPLLFAADAINYGEGNNQQAIGLYKKAIEKKLDNVDVRIGLGDAFNKEQSGGGEAMNNYENAVAKDAKNSLGHSRIGALWYAARRYDLALTSYQKAMEADPMNPLPYRDLANAYFRIGKYDMANTNIDKYWELSDKTEQDRVQRINIKFLAKEYNTVIPELNDMVSKPNPTPVFYRLLGYAQYETKDYENSLQNMRTFFAKQNPKKILPSDYTYMAKLYGQMKNADSADYYYNIALQSDTSSNKTKIWTEIAEGYKSMNTDAGYRKAAEYYGKIVKAATKPTKTDYFWYGTMSYYAKQYDEAANVFQQMETTYPDESSAMYWRGRVAAAQDADGKTGAALPFYEKWLAAVGENYDKKNDLLNVYQYGALVNYNKSNKAETQKFLDKITAIDPSNKLAAELKGLMAKPAGAKAPKKP